MRVAHVQVIRANLTARTASQRETRVGPVVPKRAVTFRVFQTFAVPFIVPQLCSVIFCQYSAPTVMRPLLLSVFTNSNYNHCGGDSMMALDADYFCDGIHAAHVSL